MTLCTNTLRSLAARPFVRTGLLTMRNCSLSTTTKTTNANFGLRSNMTRLFAQSGKIANYSPSLPLVAARGMRGGYNAIYAVQPTPVSSQLWRMAGAGAVIGLGAVALNGLQEGQHTTQGTYPSYVSERITKTYGYVAGGLGLTAGVATYIFRSGLYYRLMNVNPYAMLIGTAVGTIGSMIACQTIEHKPTQHVAWLAFNGCMGLSLFPLAMFGGALLQRAAMGTAAVVGSISLIAATTR
eukprot:Ihof_evm3s178 gene=Ihof_evmTU3s178